MNVNSKLIFLFSLFLVSFSAAQDSPDFSKRANVNLVNATAFPLRLKVTYTDVSGEDGGGKVKLRSGSDMGLFSVNSERLDLEIAVNEAESGVEGMDGHVALDGDLATNCYVVFLGVVGKKVDGELVEIPTLKLKKVEVATEEQGASLTLLSACAVPKLLKFGGRQIRLQPWKERLLKGWRGQELGVVFEGEKVGRIPGRNEPLTMLAVVYEDAEKKPHVNCFVYAIRK